MPGLFRIMGGGPGCGRPSQQQPPASTAQQHQQQQQQQQRSRNTYPGQRACMFGGGMPHAPPPPLPPPLAPYGGGLPTETPRYGGGSSTAAPPPFPSTILQQQQQRQISSLSSAASGNSTSRASGGSGSNVVLRGSNVEPGARAPPPAAPVASGTTASSRPGAYQVSRTTSGPAQVYRVTVPQGVRPGSEFTVHAGPRRVRVRCPVASKPGQSLQITLPPEPETHHLQLRMAPLTLGTGDVRATGGAVPMTPEVQKVNQQAQASGGTAQSFLVTIPPNIYPGMQFTVNVNGQRFMVTCPATAGPNMRVRIVPPAVPAEPEAAPKTQVFEVAVPPGVVSGQPFALVANGQRVLVTCPPNVSAGQKIRFQLPVSQVVGSIQLSYESMNSSGWSRTIRVSDLKFQWVRLDKKKDTAGGGGKSSVFDDFAETIDTDETFDFAKSAYVRKLTFLEGNDARMRTGTVELVPAEQATVDSKLVVHNRTLLSYADISQAQTLSLDAKTEWFHKLCTQLTPAWDDGHVQIVVRRRHLLLDSVDAVMSLGRDDLRKRWRVEFLGEPAIDAGGVAREWFELVTEQIYDPAFGLWLSSVNNQACVNINPASDMSCPDDHLVYFRFIGRMLGRALFDRQLVKGHMVRTLYRHLLGWPVTFEDIQAQDEDYYKSLKKLTQLRSEDIPNMCLDFTVTEESMGVREDVDLLEGGREKEVTSDNLAEYLEANLKYRLMERTKPQLTELLLGFFDIIPEPALTVFDANELELILCGLPNIDMDDWKANTQYSGYLSSKGRSNEVVQWFWETVTDDFDLEMKARLLQFVTGTSGVPARGFSVLQGIDGNIKRFTIHGIDLDTCPYPRAHTCFNRIDLPIYNSKKELHDRLKTAITMCAVGFGME